MIIKLKGGKMSKVILGLMLCFVLISFIVVAEDRTRVIPIIVEPDEPIVIDEPSEEDLFWEDAIIKKNFDKKIIFCVWDDDCIKTLSTVCPCSSGGIEVAVNEFGLSYLQWKISQEWEDSEFIRCTQNYNCFNTQPKCINHRCELV